MADNIDFDSANHPRVRTNAEPEQTTEGGRTGEQSSHSSPYSSALVGDSRLAGRGNSPVQASVMQSMQRTHGNRAVQRILQRSASAAAASQDEEIGERIQNKAGSGSSLDGGTRRQLEQGLGADMSGVRVHTDSEADSMARSVSSIAFTTGNDIFFKSGAYNPGSQDGMQLLAHEATHTVQQAAGPVAGTPSAGGVSISDPSDSFEQAAESAAHAVVSGGQTPAAVQKMAESAGTAIQRVGVDDEEELQTKRDTAAIQRAESEEEEKEGHESSASQAAVSGGGQSSASEEEKEGGQSSASQAAVSGGGQSSASEEEKEGGQSSASQAVVSGGGQSSASGAEEEEKEGGQSAGSESAEEEKEEE